MNDEVQPNVANGQGNPMTPLQPEVLAKALDSLPGIIGGIDNYLRDAIGQPLPFVLLVFSGNGAMHAQNFNAAEANRLVMAFADTLKKELGEGDAPV